MSAESTNVDKQAKRHRPALWGMGLVGGAVALLFFFFVVAATDGGEDDVKQMISTEEAGS